MLTLVGAAAVFALMAFTTKVVATRIPGPQIAMIRFAISLTPLLHPRIFRLSVSWKRADLVLYRGIFGGIAVLLYFSAIQHIPVGVAALLNFTSPVFSGFFAAMFLAERLRVRVVFPLALTITGVVLVTRASGSPHEFLGVGIWELAGLGSAVCAGAAVTAIRGARRTDTTWATLCGFSICGLAVTSPFGLRSWVPPDRTEWALLLVVGIFALVGQLLMTWAYRWVETLVAGVITQSTVVFAMILGVVFLNETIGWQTVLGTAFSIGGVCLVILLASRDRVITPDWRLLDSGENDS